MANTLYYTLSTIAQTLAGAFALMGAFVLFGLQLAKTRLAEVGSKVAMAEGHDTPLAKLYHEGKLREIYELSERAVKGAASNSHLPAFRTELGELLKVRRSVISRFWFSTVLTGITLAYSVAALSLVDTIVLSLNCSRSVLALGVGLFSLCLVGYASVLFAAVGKGAV